MGRRGHRGHRASDGRLSWLHFLTGTPVLVGARGEVPHAADPNTLKTVMWLCLAITACGASLILYYLQASVTIDVDRLTVRGAMGQMRFNVPYNQIDSIGEIRYENRHRFFLVAGNGQSVTIGDSYDDYESIRDQLIELAPPLSMS